MFPLQDIFWIYTRDEILLQEVVENLLIHKDTTSDKKYHRILIKVNFYLWVVFLLLR